MADNSSNVLRWNGVEEQERYRAAVARVLLNIQQETGLSLNEIADRIDVSGQTLWNAANRKNDLNHHYVNRIAVCFGVEALNPLAALTGARYAPLNPTDDDALPSLTGAVHRLAIARSPESDGGVAMTHREVLAMMPDLLAAQRAINGLILRGERLAA